MSVSRHPLTKSGVCHGSAYLDQESGVCHSSAYLDRESGV